MAQPTNATLTNYTLIDNSTSLNQFCTENNHVKWMGFDSEFVGEKRFKTLLCLIQIATPNGSYLIDTLKVKDLTPLLKMIENPSIQKITHAGENDYRLLNRLYGTVPKNVFDTQIAAGFVGYRYPVSFQRLVEKEIGIHLSKGYTVSDWESRPINKKQIQYALNDILHLQRLWQSLLQKLDAQQRTHWLEEEIKKLEKGTYYAEVPHKEALNNNLMNSLALREQIFLLRLYQWRRQEAQRKDYSKEMILPTKLIGPITRNITAGKKALKNHRRIPPKTIAHHWEAFNQLYNNKITDEERQVIAQIPENKNENFKEDTLLEMLHLLIKYRCYEHNIAPELVFPRTDFKKFKADRDYFDTSIEKGWRYEVLGKGLVQWLKNRNQLDINISDNQCTISC